MAYEAKKAPDAQPSATVTTAEAADAGFTRYQKFVIAMLAFLQFTIILDFMILSPLGATLMPELKINPSQFGLVVSALCLQRRPVGLTSQWLR